MKTRIVYQKIFTNDSPPLAGVRVMASEVVEGDGVERMNQLASYTPQSPYVPADEVHGVKYFVNSISLSEAV